MRGTSVVHSEIHFEDSHITFELAAGITTADVGKAVSLDTGGTTKAKLAVNDEHIIGRLETVEDRTNAEGKIVGTVALRLIGWLPTTGTVAVGDTLVGSATPGVAKAAAADVHATNYVVATATGKALVHKIG